MRPMSLFVLVGLAGTGLGCAVAPHSVRVVDAKGDALPTKVRDGRTVVVGKAGEGYGVRLDNDTQAPIVAVLAIDGLDAGDGTVADLGPEGHERRCTYGLGPFTTTTVDGFPLSRQREATFRFAEPAQSLAFGVTPMEDIGTVVVAMYDAIAIDAAAPVADLDFERSRARPTAEGSPAAADHGAGPIANAVFGEVRTSRWDKPRYALHPTQSRELARFAFSIESAAGSRLGTAGPPAPPAMPVATSTAMPVATSTPDLARAAAEPEEHPPASKPVKGTKGTKETKGAKGPKTPPSNAPSKPSKAPPEKTAK